MTVSAVLDSAGRRRSPATLPGFHAGRPPRNKGMRYPADPPTVEEIIAVMRQADDNRHGWRLRALIVVLCVVGFASRRRSRSPSPTLTPRRGSLLVRNGKGGRRREIGMDAWGWEQLHPWLTSRRDLPVGPLFCVITVRPAGVPGQVLPCASSFVGSPARQGCDAGSRHTSYVMLMRSSSPGRAYR
ncbi:MAG: hypothetical protein ACHQE6_00010 [Solirubrobacterales bacterium]